MLSGDERYGDDVTSGPALESCPTCGRPGCVGYCELEDLVEADPQAPVWMPCVCCGLHDVCVSEGWDTCTDCLSKQ